MERGESRVALAVVSVLSVTGVMAVLALFAQNPTGGVMQDQSVYPTSSLPMIQSCQAPQENAIFMGYQNNALVFCCPEDMTGQNECRFPHRILMTRGY